MEKKPDWLRVNYNAAAIQEISGLMASLKLNTVCKEASCPNMGECYKKHTATFMILGTQCTRNCRFCNVTHGRPQPVDPDEPAHLAEAVEALGLRHVVVTSVTRDDLPDGGAGQFAAVIRAVKDRCPGVTIEVLIPDMQENTAALDQILREEPTVINHNLETVPSLYGAVRPGADYARSLRVLRYVKNAAPDRFVKTGIMVGLGETAAEIDRLMDDALENGCDILTIGQYLRPSLEHLPVVEYVTPETFAWYKKRGEEKGFRYVASSPLVRSSYRAAEALSRGVRR